MMISNNCLISWCILKYFSALRAKGWNVKASEYCFTSLSARSWQYRDRRKLEARTMPYSYFEWLRGFSIVQSTIDSNVQSMPLNRLELKCNGCSLFASGAFRVEMQRESQKDRTILCRYDPAELGDYIISIKWSGQHVPGSPYHVLIFQTEEELKRFKMENPQRRLNGRTLPQVITWSEDI